MPDYNQALYAFEVHSVEKIKKYFEEGGNPNEINEGVPLFKMMIEMYARTPRFKDCVQTFIDAGLEYENKALLAVFIDDASKMQELIEQYPDIVSNTYSLYNNTYTPLTGGTLLHFCAEYNSINCAKILVANGADVNVKAAYDEYGFGGHTPIFHTVNQNSNNSADMFYFLLEQGADLQYTVKGLIWGRGYEWETFIPAVNAVSYAMMGLLPQMHRKEKTIADVVALLVKRAYGVDYVLPNIPNAYLKR